jgi:hypothetical protein
MVVVGMLILEIGDRNIGSLEVLGENEQMVLKELLPRHCLPLKS